jgi:DNA-directed RNA polymerase specialized sigma24 family protein
MFLGARRELRKIRKGLAGQLPLAALRNEILHLRDEGVEPAQIARKLNVSVGEVGLVIQTAPQRTTTLAAA